MAATNPNVEKQVKQTKKDQDENKPTQPEKPPTPEQSKEPPTQSKADQLPLVSFCTPTPKHTLSALLHCNLTLDKLTLPQIESIFSFLFGNLPKCAFCPSGSSSCIVRRDDRLTTPEGGPLPNLCGACNQISPHRLYICTGTHPAHCVQCVMKFAMTNPNVSHPDIPSDSAPAIWIAVARLAAAIINARDAVLRRHAEAESVLAGLAYHNPKTDTSRRNTLAEKENVVKKKHDKARHLRSSSNSSQIQIPSQGLGCVRLRRRHIVGMQVRRSAKDEEDEEKTKSRSKKKQQIELDESFIEPMSEDDDAFAKKRRSRHRNRGKTLDPLAKKPYQPIEQSTPSDSLEYSQQSESHSDSLSQERSGSESGASNPANHNQPRKRKANLEEETEPPLSQNRGRSSKMEAETTTSLSRSSSAGSVQDAEMYQTSLPESRERDFVERHLAEECLRFIEFWDDKCRCAFDISDLDVCRRVQHNTEAIREIARRLGFTDEVSFTQCLAKQHIDAVRYEKAINTIQKRVTYLTAHPEIQRKNRDSRVNNKGRPRQHASSSKKKASKKKKQSKKKKKSHAARQPQQIAVCIPLSSFSLFVFVHSKPPTAGLSF